MNQNVSVEPRERSADRWDALILVPAFFELRYPSLGAHVLQACARAAGFRVRVFYANLLFASHIGLTSYATVAKGPPGTFVGERLFARAAYGVPPLGAQADMFRLEQIYETRFAPVVYQDEDSLPWASYRLELLRIEAQVPTWVEAAGKYIADLGIPVIGATTTFQQTAPAIALLGAVRRHASGVTTIIGGANCEGEMAEGIRSIAPFIDYVFSGESEHTFPELLRGLARGERPAGRVIQGRPCNEMDAIPALDYDDYFEQRPLYLSSADDAVVGKASLPYETSRGCWWGMKQHCTFCGLNGEGMGFRGRSPDRVIDELRELVAKYRPASVLMADNIMPYTYFSTVVPRLAKELPGLNIFYEQKANLPRERLVLLKHAGIHTIQPGIEALSSKLLTFMRKGTTARQNVALLRDARGVQITLAWGLLWGFPGDRPAWYEETLAILPLLHHLQPPSAFGSLSFDRFSPYFDQAEQFGISDLRPYAGYRDFLPAGAPLEKVAYHFTGEFRCAADEAPDLMRAVNQAVGAWKASWTGRQPPELRVRKYAGVFCLVDTRGLPGCPLVEVLDARAARRLVVSEPYDDSPEQRSLIRRKLALRLDEYFVPLAVADQSIFMRVNEAAASTQPGEEQRVGVTSDGPSENSTSGLTAESIGQRSGPIDADVAAVHELYPRAVAGARHGYTSLILELARAVADKGYRSDGVGFYGWPVPFSGTVPFYKLSHQRGDQLYTTSTDEVYEAVSKNGFVLDSVPCYLFSSPAIGLMPLLWLQNDARGDSLFTTSLAEAQQAAAHGYAGQGVAGYVSTSYVLGTVPVYRLSKPS